MNENIQDIIEIVSQSVVPFIIRYKKSRVDVRLPYRNDNRDWLRNQRNARTTSISYNKSLNLWEIPKGWFNDTVELCLDRYRAVFIIQPYRAIEKCAPACYNAKGHICQCSCMGKNHGSRNDGSWFEVTETFAFRYGDEELACRLLRR